MPQIKKKKGKKDKSVKIKQTKKKYQPKLSGCYLSQ